MTENESAPLRPAESASVADWLLRSLSTSGSHVSSYVPDTFDRFVRILNPAIETVTNRPVTWAEVAHIRGVPLTPTTQWEDLVQGLRRKQLDSIWIEPKTGSLDVAMARRLAEILHAATTTPAHAYFGFWEGYVDEHHRVAPSVVLPPDRRIHLMAGPVLSGPRSMEPGPFPFDRLPLRWWPADHAWCVGNDIYARSVFVGGSASTIQAILNDQELEAYEVDPNTEVGVEDF